MSPVVPSRFRIVLLFLMVIVLINLPSLSVAGSARDMLAFSVFPLTGANLVFSFGNAIGIATDTESLILGSLGTMSGFMTLVLFSGLDETAGSIYIGTAMMTVALGLGAFVSAMNRRVESVGDRSAPHRELVSVYASAQRLGVSLSF